jgi:hypothetical protein
MDKLQLGLKFETDNVRQRCFVGWRTTQRKEVDQHAGNEG